MQLISFLKYSTQRLKYLLFNQLAACNKASESINTEKPIFKKIFIHCCSKVWGHKNFYFLVFWKKPPRLIKTNILLLYYILNHILYYIVTIFYSTDFYFNKFEWHLFFDDKAIYLFTIISVTQFLRNHSNMLDAMIWCTGNITYYVLLHSILDVLYCILQFTMLCCLFFCRVQKYCIYLKQIFFCSSSSSNLIYNLLFSDFWTIMWLA